MTDREYAIIVSVVLSIILSLVQIASDSTISNWKSYFTLQFVFYILIMTFGNILSTLLAEGMVENFQSGENPGGLILKEPVWIWYSAFGVFGFEAIIQKINITIFDKGVFSLSDWITKAKATAVAATLERAADLATFVEQDLGPKLYKALTQQELHTLVASILGNDLYQRALASIQGNPQIIPELYLATIATTEAPKKVKAALKSYENNKG